MSAAPAFASSATVTSSFRRPRVSHSLPRQGHVRTLSVSKTSSSVRWHHREASSNVNGHVFAAAMNSNSATIDSNSGNKSKENGTNARTTSNTTTLPGDVVVLEALAGKRVVVTGGTGMIGRELVSRLLQAQAHVTLLARNTTLAKRLFPTSQMSVLAYDAALNTPLSSSVQDKVIGADIVVNLAGEPIESGRWTNARKRELRNSRITGTRKLASILDQSVRPITFVSASAIGYYGASESLVFTEDDSSGSDFLADLASEWESVALESKHSGRTVVLRFGVVLSPTGGALNKMIPAFRAFLGGPPGSGRQWFSWVHIDDLVRLILHSAVDQKWNGIYNATAPQPVRLAEFCKELGRALGRPSWLPLPAQAVQLMLGGEAAQLVLAGQNVVPKRTRENGFVYKYKDVGSALQNLLNSNSEQLSRIS